MSDLETRRTRRAGGAKRALVLDRVVEVISERGYAGTRFIDVSGASGVAVSTLQGYFGSREDMLIEALRRVTSVAVSDMNESAARFDDDPWQQLLSMLDRGLYTDAGTWRVLMEFWSTAAHDTELQEHAAALAKLYRQPFTDAVQRGIDDGAFAPRFTTTAIVEAAVSSIVGLLYPVVLEHLSTQVAEYREVIVSQLAFALNVDAKHTSGAPSDINPKER